VTFFQHLDNEALEGARHVVVDAGVDARASVKGVALEGT
jgi:hypothetical protein